MYRLFSPSLLIYLFVLYFNNNYRIFFNDISYISSVNEIALATLWLKTNWDIESVAFVAISFICSPVYLILLKSLLSSIQFLV
jgi:hypothetical protein